MTHLVISLCEAWWSKGLKAVETFNKASDAPALFKPEGQIERRKEIEKAQDQMAYWNGIGGE